MKKIFFLLLLFLSFSPLLFSQFVTVKDGDWIDPKTWSTDPDASVIPGANDDVTVIHTVVIASTYEEINCKNLTVTSSGIISNRTSDWVGSHLIVKGKFVNNGNIQPSFDKFFVTIDGDFVNNGVITKNYQADKFTLTLRSGLYNNGSFRNVSNVLFEGFGSAHQHSIKSLNDSVIYFGELLVKDSLGTILVDSLARISAATFNLNQSKMIIPPSVFLENKLIFHGGSIQYGTIEANFNSIYTADNTWLTLGKTYYPETNIKIVNAKLPGNYLIAGDNNVSFVVLKGVNVLTGKMADAYTTSIWSAGDRGVKVEGVFTNEGRIYSSHPSDDYGLWLRLTNESEFVNNQDSLEIHRLHFSGLSRFTSLRDTLSLRYIEGNDSLTHAVLKSNVFLKKTSTVDMKGGKLQLPFEGTFKTLYQWFNVLQNTKLLCNESLISFSCIEGKVAIFDPGFEYINFKQDVIVNGKAVVKGTIQAYQNSPVVTVLDEIHNYGAIKDHPTWGYLFLDIKGNAFHDGKAWTNMETKFSGLNNQHIIMPHDSIIKGKVIFDAMISGVKYQWQKNGVDIPEATGSKMVFSTGLNSTDYGVYQCIVNDTLLSRTILVGREIPPAFTINDVIIKNITKTSAMIRWTTSVPTTGFVFYAENDVSQGYPLEAMEPHILKQEHEVILENLTTGATCYFVIDQNDAGWENNIRSDEFSFVVGDLSVGALKIRKITDVPDDQGGWVFVEFDADVFDSTGGISHYGIWEWIEDDWVGLGVVPATQKNAYTFLAHTPKDSVEVCKFYISAHTLQPTIFYVSAVDSGYSVDNLIPGIPEGLMAVQQNKVIRLSWLSNPDPDIQYYIVYKNQQKLSETISTSFDDVDIVEGNNVYQISAVDFSGNESLKSAEFELLITSTELINGLNDYQIRNIPNPFNDFTYIQYYLPFAAVVQIDLYDLTGKMIKTILSENQLQGNQNVHFEADNLPAGVYFYKVKIDGNESMHKMIIR